MNLTELSNDQRRHFIDVEQAFQAWRDAERERVHGFLGTMHWRTVGDREYLGRKHGNKWIASLGARSTETEHTKSAYEGQRERVLRRCASLKARLKELAPINRAYRLGRMPEIAAKVIRKIDSAGLMGTNLLVAGTHCLFAYEARCGVVIGGGLTATADIDLLLDTRRSLRFLTADSGAETLGVLGLLQRVDRSFVATANQYSAVNDEGYYIDLIRPTAKNEIVYRRRGLTADDGLEASPVAGLEWLISAPKLEQTIIGIDGLPAFCVCVDPRVFALHKRWLSEQPQRDPKKRRRDEEQAYVAAAIAVKHLGLKFNSKDLTSLPMELARGAKALTAAL